MDDRAKAILDALQLVESLRRHRAADPALSARVTVIKAHQTERFADTYRDLLCDPRYHAAAEFFLRELYGPHEFAERDAQFARVVPTLVRMFPNQLQSVLLDLASLHALSEHLDAQMAACINDGPLSQTAYANAWRLCGRTEARKQQIDLTIRLGHALERLTRSRMLRNALRMMRAPAKAAHLAELQQVLECGFDAFGAMKGSAEFLALIEQRERAFAEMQFSGRGDVPRSGASPGRRLDGAQTAAEHSS